MSVYGNNSDKTKKKIPLTKQGLHIHIARWIAEFLFEDFFVSLTHHPHDPYMYDLRLKKSITYRNEDNTYSTYTVSMEEIDRLKKSERGAAFHIILMTEEELNLYYN